MPVNSLVRELRQIFCEGAGCIHRQPDIAHMKSYLRTSVHLVRQQALARWRRDPRRDTWTPLKKYPTWSQLSQRARESCGNLLGAAAGCPQVGKKGAMLNAQICVAWISQLATNYLLSVLLGWHSGCLNLVIYMSTTSNLEDGHALSWRNLERRPPTWTFVPSSSQL